MNITDKKRRSYDSFFLFIQRGWGMKSSKNKMCVQHIFDFVCTGIARTLYAQSP